MLSKKFALIFAPTCCFLRFASKTDYDMTKEEPVRFITMELISSALTRGILRTTAGLNGDHTHSTLHSTATNSKLLDLDMVSVHVFKLEKSFHVMDLFQLVNTRTSLFIDDL